MAAEAKVVQIADQRLDVTRSVPLQPSKARKAKGWYISVDTTEHRNRFWTFCGNEYSSKKWFFIHETPRSQSIWSQTEKFKKAVTTVEPAVKYSFD